MFSYHPEPGPIILETSFLKDLDSLDVVELIMALEEELGVKISDQEAEKIKTEQERVRLIRRYARE